MVGNLDRLGRIPRVADCTELFLHAILRNPSLKPQIVVVDQENISLPGLSEHKRPARLIIERVQHQHEHNFERNPTGEIVRVVHYIQPSKPTLNKNHKHAQMEFSEWASKKKLEKGGIFIY